IVGLAIRAERNVIDKIVDKLTLHQYLHDSCSRFPARSRVLDNRAEQFIRSTFGKCGFWLIDEPCHLFQKESVSYNVRRENQIEFPGKYCTFSLYYLSARVLCHLDMSYSEWMKRSS